MELKKIEKASKLLERVKELDKEIIEIDRKANLILDNETEITFELRVKKKNQKEDTKKLEPKFEVNIFTIFSEMNSLQKSKTISEQLINIEKIDEKTALSILGVMLNKKNTERNKLLKQMENIFK